MGQEGLCPGCLAASANLWTLLACGASQQDDRHHGGHEASDFRRENNCTQKDATQRRNLVWTDRHPLSPYVLLCRRMSYYVVVCSCHNLHILNAYKPTKTHPYPTKNRPISLMDCVLSRHWNFIRGCFWHRKHEQLFHRNTGNDCNAQ